MSTDDEKYMNALTQVRRALEHWGLRVDDTTTADRPALLMHGLTFDGVEDEWYVVTITPDR